MEKTMEDTEEQLVNLVAGDTISVNNEGTNKLSKKTVEVIEKQPDNLASEVIASVNNEDVNEFSNYNKQNENHMETHKEQNKASEKSISEISGDAVLQSDIASEILIQNKTPTKENPQEPAINSACSSFNEIIPSPFKRVLFCRTPKHHLSKKGRLRKYQQLPPQKIGKDIMKIKKIRKLN